MAVGKCMGVRRSWRGVLICGLLLGSVLLAWAGYRYGHHPWQPGKSGARIALDLDHPDMVLSTHNLSEIPKDVVKAPLLAGLVDEDLAFYYEEDEARLSLEGTLRRLGFEHKLPLKDRFLATLLNAPAYIGFWQSAKGRPEYFVATLERGALAQLAEVWGKIALDDRQLQQVDTVRVGTKTSPVYTLRYGGQRTMVFAGHGERWVFVSHAGMVLADDNKTTPQGAALLARALGNPRPWDGVLATSQAARHSLTVGARALTLGYARFVPALQGLRVNFDGHSWQTELQLDAKALPAQTDPAAALSALWRAVPTGAGMCAALPVDWQASKQPLGDLLEDNAGVHAVVNAMAPFAAVCWYAGSRLSAPLFVAQADKPLPKKTAEVMARLAAKAWTEEGVAQDKGSRYGSTVASRHGMKTRAQDGRSFTPTILRRGSVLAFSPDRRHVDAVQAVAEKRAPAVADTLGSQGAAWLLLDPARLGPLVRAEVSDVLPADEESYLRDVARQRLWPRLEAWGKRQQPQALVQGEATGTGTGNGDSFTRLLAMPLGAAATTAR